MNDLLKCLQKSFPFTNWALKQHEKFINCYCNGIIVFYANIIDNIFYTNPYSFLLNYNWSYTFSYTFINSYQIIIEMYNKYLLI